MLDASLYIIACSARNRTRVRLKRLREPRYLVGAVAGAAYLYFSIFARMGSKRFASPRRAAGARRARSAIDGIAAVAAPFGAVALLLIAALGWLIPFESGLLEFSEPEVAFLFPAPVSRRAVLVHRIIRSQIGLLFSALVFAVAFPASGGLSRFRTGAAMWVLLLTARLYFTGVSLARARMRSNVAAERLLGWAPAIFVWAAALAVGAAMYRALLTTHGSFLEQLDRTAAAVTHGAAAIALWPFAALLAPVFASSTPAFLIAIGVALLILAVAAAWVLTSDDLFQAAASDLIYRREAARALRQRSQFTARASGVELALTGRPELAFAWKGMMQTLRIVDRRSVVRLVVIIGALTVAAVARGRANGLTAILGVFAAIGAGFATLMAPQALRLDFREDLRHLELLKTWPIAPAAVVRGEMLWPSTALTLLAWGLLAIALALSYAGFADVPAAMRAAAAVAAALVAPALILAQYMIHNAVALFFPGWVPLGSNRPRGVDAMGQRLILLGGTWLVLAAMALPGAIGGGLLWAALRPWFGAGALVPAAALASTVIAIEVLICSEALGPAFERVDVSSVERAD